MADGSTRFSLGADDNKVVDLFPHAALGNEPVAEVFGYNSNDFTGASKAIFEELAYERQELEQAVSDARRAYNSKKYDYDRLSPYSKEVIDSAYDNHRRAVRKKVSRSVKAEAQKLSSRFNAKAHGKLGYIIKRLGEIGFVYSKQYLQAIKGHIKFDVMQPEKMHVDMSKFSKGEFGALDPEISRLQGLMMEELGGMLEGNYAEFHEEAVELIEELFNFRDNLRAEFKQKVTARRESLIAAAKPLNLNVKKLLTSSMEQYRCLSGVSDEAIEYQASVKAAGKRSRLLREIKKKGAVGKQLHEILSKSETVPEYSFSFLNSLGNDLYQAVVNDPSIKNLLERYCCAYEDILSRDLHEKRYAGLKASWIEKDLDKPRVEMEQAELRLQLKENAIRSVIDGSEGLSLKVYKVDFGIASGLERFTGSVERKFGFGRKAPAEDQPTPVAA